MSSCRLWCCFSSQAADGAAAADRVPEVQVVTVAERVDATDGRALATSAKDSKQTVHAPRQSEPEPKPEFVVVPSLEVAGHPQYKKFGAVFAVVAEALCTISLDIVGMIASFLRFSPPSHATQPVFVRQFGSAKNAEFESVYAIAEAPNLEHMWVSAGGCVRIITKQGHFVSRVDGRFAEPHQIAFDSNGEVFVADWMRSLVQVCSLQGQHLRELAKYYDDEFERTSDRRFLDSPGGVAVDGKGRVAVAEVNNHRVHILTPLGETVCLVGGYGTEQSQLRFPREVAISPSNELFVADEDNQAVKVFNLDTASTGECKFVREFKPHTDALPILERGFRPYGLCLQRASESATSPSDCNVFVTDSISCKVYVFKADGTAITEFDGRGPPEPGDESTKLHTTRGVCVDSEGQIYVCHWSRAICVFGFAGS